MGYSVMAQRLAVTNGTDNFSSPISLGGGNAVQIDAICYNLGGATSYTIEVQGSNDGSNYFVMQGGRRACARLVEVKGITAE